MGLFEKLHQLEEEDRDAENSRWMISKEIDELLENLGYKKDSPAGHGESQIGLTRWYCGQLCRTHVCVYADKMHMYKNLECGGYEGDAIIEVPEELLESAPAFKRFLENEFESRAWLFDSEFRE